jgi:hypothetical protein
MSMALVPLVNAKVLITFSMHASFSFHQSNLQLAYTTQACYRRKETCAMQANICNAYSKCNIQVYEL